MQIETIGIVLKPNAPQGDEILHHLIPWLSDRKKKVRILNLQGARRLPRVEMILVLGGDGTLLSVARHGGACDVPILAVNIGHLGFLTEITRDELYTHLTQVFESAYQTDTRMMLDGVIHRGRKQIKKITVLNDIVVHKGACALGIPIETRIDGAVVTAFRGDGLIIASATGSTAYTLSAGGPIVHPSVAALVLTPIAPHVLTNRPIVVPASSEIQVRVQSDKSDAAVAFDGQNVFPLRTGDSVSVRASERRLNLIRSSKRDYYQVLREKLKWGTSALYKIKEEDKG